jgi:hypothetical protein
VRPPAALVCWALLALLPQVFALEVQLSPNPPEASTVLFSFEGVPGGSMGWMGAGGEGSFRDLGMSFPSPEDGEIRAITVHISGVPKDFLDEAPFTITVFQTQKANMVPQEHEALVTEQGKVRLTGTDVQSYMTFVLDEPVPVEKGASYSFLLAWQETAPYQIVALSLFKPYKDGMLWQRRVPGGPLRYGGDSTKPGLVFYVQRTAS